ncbi:MAG: NAD-dependent epimerase/dehydratase family protein [Clostridia bacterium]
MRARGGKTVERSTEPVLVTGAAGFIGYHLSKRLTDSGVPVIGLDNLNDYYEVSLKEARLAMLKTSPLFDFVKADLADADAVSRVFSQYRPQVVVNLAAQAGVRYSIDNPRAYIASNVAGFLNVLEGCRNHPVKHLLYASSSSVYGNRAQGAFSLEDRVDKPVSLYAATKLSGELMAYTYSHLYGIPATGLRFFTVYGPFGRPDMAYFSFTRKILAHEPIKVFGEGRMMRDFTYVDDVVTALLRMLDCPPEADAQGDRYRLYNIGNSRPEKLMDFIETLENCLGVPAQKQLLPMQPGDVRTTYADVSALERDFDYRPATTIAQGLQAFVDWYRRYYR